MITTTAILEEREQTEIMEREVRPVVIMADAIVVKTDDDFTTAQETLKEIKRRQKAIHEKFDPPVRSAHEAWKKAKDLYNTFMKPFEDAESIIKRKVIAYQSELERKRQEEARKAEAARLEAERKERERLEAQAKKAEEKGKVEKAEALREQAETVVAAPVFMPPPPPQVKGSNFRKVWKGKVIDIKALCQAIGSGHAPINFIELNQAAINAYAKATKNSMPVPGVVFSEETEMSVRG